MDISRRKTPALRPGRETRMSQSVQSQPAEQASQRLGLNGNQPSRTSVAGPVHFPDLVRAHYDWRKAVEDGRPSDDVEATYYAMLDRFQSEYGQIVNAYWCLDKPSAVALTERPRARWLRPHVEFHRVTDWATQGKPRIAAGLHRCDELAIRSTHVLRGIRKRIALQMVMASAAHLLSLADGKATRGEGEDVLKQELDPKKGTLKRCEEYYCDAANGQAQMIYFGGMVSVAVALAIVSVLSTVFVWLPNIDDRSFFGALLAGALGALVSVVARVNSGRFDLEYDVGLTYPFFLGGLRPLMGAIFGLGVFFAIESGLLTIPKLSGDDSSNKVFAGIIVLAFVSGFSERWAKDTLAAAAGDAPKKRATKGSDE